MPFMHTHEPEDTAMLMALHRTSARGRLDHILAHSVFKDGIDDGDIPLAISGAFVAATRQDVENLEKLLAPGNVNVQTLPRGTALTPHMKFSIVSTGIKVQPWVAGAVIDSVNLVERTIGKPLPVSHVVVVISALSTCGCTTGFAFDVPLEMHQAKDTLEGHRLQGHAVHELSHYYWQDLDQWVNEGISRSFETLYGMIYELYPNAYRNQRGKCEDHDIQTHMELLTSGSRDVYHCRHYLGGGLFLELLEILGTSEFSGRLRQLHDLAAEGQWLGIEQVRQVFHDQPEIVEKHWSGKLNAPENRPWDEGMADSSHNLIQWDQDPTYDGEFVTFSGSLLGDAVLSSGTIKEAERDGYQNFHLYPVRSNEFGGNIFPPGWGSNMRHPGDTTALEYRLEDRTFTVKFRFPQKLGDPSDYIVDVWGFQDESRTPVIWPDRDRLGYARIRVE